MKKEQVPKVAEYKSDIIQEFTVGKFSDLKVGNIVRAENLSKAIKENGGKAHTGTIQNVLGVGQLMKYLRSLGWDVVDIKGDYPAFQKIDTGDAKLDKLEKEIKTIRKILSSK